MTRPKDHLIAAAVSEIARLGSVCGTHQSFRQQVSQIVVPLVDGLAQMEREAMEAAPVVAISGPGAWSADVTTMAAPEYKPTSPENLVRQRDHLAVVMDLHQQLAYHEDRNTEHIARLCAELTEARRQMDAQMARLNENLTAANARIAELELEVEVCAGKMARNPWRDAIIEALKARNRYFERDNGSPTDKLQDLLRDVAAAASHTTRQQLGALAGLADQLVHTGLAIRAAQQPEDRNDVALAYRDDSPRIAEDTIPAIDGWKIGCVVQSRYRGVDHADNEWRDVGIAGRPCTPNFLHPMMEYRVKPG